MSEEKQRELKPCPFCGKACDGDCFHAVPGMTSQVVCRHCGAMGPVSTMTEQRDKSGWNTRA